MGLLAAPTTWGTEPAEARGAKGGVADDLSQYGQTSPSTEIVSGAHGCERATDRTVPATHHQGESLTAEHGFPLGLVAPHPYAYKSPK